MQLNSENRVDQLEAQRRLFFRQMNEPRINVESQSFSYMKYGPSGPQSCKSNSISD